MVAAIGQQLPRALVAELHQRGLVDLHVAAANVVERLDLLAVGLHQIGEEAVEVWIGGLVDIGAAGPIVNVGRARKRDLRRAARDRFQEREVGGVLRALPCDLACHGRNAPGGAMAVRFRLRPALLFRQPDFNAVQPADCE